jgi:hypothetical protein
VGWLSRIGLPEKLQTFRHRIGTILNAAAGYSFSKFLPVCFITVLVRAHSVSFL